LKAEIAGLRHQHIDLPQLRDDLFCRVSFPRHSPNPPWSKPYFREDHFKGGRSALGEFHSFFAPVLGDGDISVDDYFRPLCSVLTRSVLRPLGVQCTVFIGAGYLSAIKCQWLDLIVAELVINASKYAFDDADDGCVTIDIDGRDGLWTCMVSDNGVGMGNYTRGTGSLIFDKLTEALGGDLAIRTGASGTAVSIEFCG
jgi:two-component sensor histidine kinase